jgi:hypothetical protein
MPKLLFLNLEIMAENKLLDYKKSKIKNRKKRWLIKKIQEANFLRRTIFLKTRTNFKI